MLLIAGETVQTITVDIYGSFDFVEQTLVRGVKVNAEHTCRKLSGRVCANVAAHDRLAYNPHIVSIG